MEQPKEIDVKIGEECEYYQKNYGFDMKTCGGLCHHKRKLAYLKCYAGTEEEKPETKSTKIPINISARESQPATEAKVIKLPSGRTFRKLERTGQGIRALSKSTTVRKSNVLIDSRYDMTKTETKLALYMLTRIDRDDRNFKLYRIQLRNFTDLLPAKRTGFYHEAKNIVRRLMKESVIEIPIDEGVIMIPLLAKAIVRKNSGCVDFTFSHELKPHLLELKEKFTSFKIDGLLKLKGKHAIRLYEILKSFHGLKRRTLTIEDLYKMLWLDGKYKTFRDFKRKILEPARKEINKLTDIKIGYKPVYQSNKVASLEFTIKSKQQQQQQGRRRVKKIALEDIAGEHKGITKIIEKIVLKKPGIRNISADDKKIIKLASTNIHEYWKENWKNNPKRKKIMSRYPIPFANTYLKPFLNDLANNTNFKSHWLISKYFLPNLETFIKEF